MDLISCNENQMIAANDKWISTNMINSSTNYTIIKYLIPNLSTENLKVACSAN